jgi:Chalcone isomerase-like
MEVSMKRIFLCKAGGASVARMIAAAVGFALATSAIALDVAGVKIDERVKVANQDLVLNGAGVRYAAAGFVRVYVAALYLPQKKNTSNEIGALKGAKRMHLSVMRDINSNDFSKALLSGMRANLSSAEQQKHFESLLKLGQIFGQIPSLKKGESITIDSIPTTGTMILVNNKRVGEVFQDDTFFQALIQIWIGPKPIDDSLKPVLLGTVASNDNTVNNNTRERF